MAAGIYLLLMWGYLALPSAQLFAAFTALIMSAALYLWVRETTAIQAFHAAEQASPIVKACVVQSSVVATLKLNSLKEELTEQYAQFGRDQVRLNSSGLGTWHHISTYKGQGGISKGGNDAQP